MRSAFARLINHFLSVGIRLCQNFLITLLCLGELLFDFFRVDLALFDLAPAFLQHRKDWLVGKAPPESRHNRKTNHLCKEQLPGPTECFGRIVQRFSKTTRRSSSDDYIHTWACRFLVGAEGLVREKEERIEHDRLRKSDGQNSTHQDLGKGTGISPDSCRHAQTR